MDDIKPSRDEMETTISFTARERIDGIVHVFTDDPVWVRKLEVHKGFEDVTAEMGLHHPSRAFRSENGTVTVSLRLKREYTDEQREEASLRLERIRP